MELEHGKEKMAVYYGAGDLIDRDMKEGLEEAFTGLNIGKKERTAHE